MSEPKITLEGVKIRALHLTSVDFEVRLKVQNPNSISVTLRELPFTIFFRTRNRQEEIALGNAGKLEIAANGSTDITVPVTTHNLVLIKALATLIEKGGIQLEIKGNAVIDHIMAGWTLPFTKTFEISKHEIVEAIGGKIPGKKGP